jgi:aminoglycoside phosphotransferase (APT) family kinase protein
MTRLHEDEIEVDVALVRRLLTTLSASYGDLPTAVPEIVAVGEPGFGYPEKWSLVRFLAGDRPAVPRVDEPPRAGLAADLAVVIRALGELAVPGAATADPGLRWYRGRPLASMDDWMQQYLRDCRELAQRVRLDLDLDAVEAAWAQAVAMPEASREVEPRWYHGDVNAENLLVRDGRMVALLDFGGLSVGDPAIDLVVVWQLLDPAARSTFRSLLAVDDATWGLARAWALVLGVMGLPYYWDTLPERCARGLFTARQALADISG